MITTHVLDTALGRPARGVPITLDRHTPEGWETLGTGATDDDGRLRTLTPPGPVPPGRYRISFDTATYFAGTPHFFPVAEIHFLVTDGTAHYHVPLLLSPFGYSTYRGS